MILVLITYAQRSVINAVLDYQATRGRNVGPSLHLHSVYESSEDSGEFAHLRRLA